MAGSDDDVHIHASMSGDVTEALDKATVAAEEAEHALSGLGKTGVKVGEELEAGMDKAKNSTQRARNALSGVTGFRSSPAPTQ